MIKHIAEREGYTKFLSNALNSNDTSGITQWAQDKLLSSPSVSKSKKQAFFEAEKILIKSYILDNNTEKIKQLVQAIDCTNKPKLIKYECELLLQSLREEKNTLQNNQVLQDTLKQLLIEECSKLPPDDKDTINQSVEDFFVALAGTTGN